MQSVAVSMILLVIISFFTKLSWQIIVGIFAITCGIFFILGRDRLRYGFRSNWTDLGFYIWGIIIILIGITIMIDSLLLELILYILIIALFILHSVYYKKKKEKKIC